MSASAINRSRREIRISSGAFAILFLLIYLEWGDRGAFIFQMAIDIIRKGTPESLTHPLVAGPLLALALLLGGAVVPRMPKWLLFAASLPPAIVAVIALIGSVSSRGLPSCVSVLPAITAWVSLLRQLRRR